MNFSWLTCGFSWISCQKYTEMASKRLDAELSLREKVAYSLHHIACMVCRRFNRQIKLIDSGLKTSFSHDHHNEEDACLSHAAKERIAKELEKQQPE